jgi:hypothetical protein
MTEDIINMIPVNGMNLRTDMSLKKVADQIGEYGMTGYCKNVVSIE